MKQCKDKELRLKKKISLVRDEIISDIFVWRTFKENYVRLNNSGNCVNMMVQDGER